jgi:hypothetical protein
MAFLCSLYPNMDHAMVALVTECRPDVRSASLWFHAMFGVMVLEKGKEKHGFFSETLWKCDAHTCGD